MADFQLIVSAGYTPNGSRLVYFTIGTSYISGANYVYNVTGIDGEGNHYTGVARRDKFGQFFLTQPLTLTT